MTIYRQDKSKRKTCRHKRYISIRINGENYKYCPICPSRIIADINEYHKHKQRFSDLISRDIDNLTSQEVDDIFTCAEFVTEYECKNPEVLK